MILGRSIFSARAWRAALCVLPLLASCGGGGSSDDHFPPATCSVRDQQVRLRDYMDDWYFWEDDNPSPSIFNYDNVGDFFEDLLFEGNSTFPADRWSYREDEDSFNRFFGDGEDMGYGVSVAGIEVANEPDQPLYVRLVAAGSPAADAGVERGDRVVSINGTSAADLIRDGDFDVLSPDDTGDRITLVVATAASGGTVERTVELVARTYDLTPINGATIVATPAGRRLGYVRIDQMISQGNAPLEDVFGDFKAAGVDDVVIDLRYNGGGLVSSARNVASHVTGSVASGETFARLLYNDKRDDENETFEFENPSSALGLRRVYLLAGPRTCSASEQVINGLRPFVDVVVIGDTTCGKPVGFLPWDDGCDMVYSVVNFETVNADREVRYFDGFDATCEVAEDFTRPLGVVGEPLLDAARRMADGNSCPTASFTAPARERPHAAERERRLRSEGERGGVMIPR